MLSLGRPFTSSSPNREYAAVILGGYVNGLGIVKSLAGLGCSLDIYVADKKKSVASFSRHVRGNFELSDDNSLGEILQQLAVGYRKVIVYPTGDEYLYQLAILHARDELPAEVFRCFSETDVLSQLEKGNQSIAAAAAGVRIPRSETIHTLSELEDLFEQNRPLLLKPTRTDRASSSHFRSALLESQTDLLTHAATLERYFVAGGSISASELIPGDDASIFAYTAYVDRTGSISSEWCGRKLGQFPDDFGVFSTSELVEDEELATLGRLAISSLGCTGICQVEFKKSSQDGELYFIEFSLRSDMWHRTGAVGGINIPAAQLAEAIGAHGAWQLDSQPSYGRLCYVYHEFGNLLSRKEYLGRFIRNVFGNPGSTEYVFFDRRDLLPLANSGKALILIIFEALRARVKKFHKVHIMNVD